MEYPRKSSCIVEVRRESNPNQWVKALFHWNGTHPTFARFGSEIFDVIEWRNP